jgi:hypothetical protein
MGNFRSELRDLGWKDIGVRYFKKDNLPVAKSINYRNVDCVESILMAGRDGFSSTTWNYNLESGQKRENIWSYGPEPRILAKDNVHASNPAQKPIALMMDLLDYHSTSVRFCLLFPLV